MQNKIDVTISLGKKMLQKLDGEVERGEHENRSEAIRKKLEAYYRFKTVAEKDDVASFIERVEYLVAHPEMLEEFKDFIQAGRRGDS